MRLAQRQSATIAVGLEAMTNDISKVAVVTGAARGIGLATAKRFLSDGWCAALLDIDAETLNRTHDALAQSGKVIAICCDVADPAGVARAFSTVGQEFGRLDALVNNAGVAVFKPILDLRTKSGHACWRSISAGLSCACRRQRR